MVPDTRAPETPRRPLTVDRGELVELLKLAGSAEAPVWMKAYGGSMTPAIPAGALVRLRAVPPAPLQPGAVVFALLPGGRCVLHRVLEERAGLVRLRGDAAVLADPPVPRESVLAIADVVEVDGRSWPVGARARWSPRTLLLPFWRLLRTILPPKERR